MSLIPTKHIDGDASVSRNAAIGGNAIVQGRMFIGHDLIVKGWLEAPNIKGVLKGLFATKEALVSAYPQPQPGWFALVGNTVPAEVWRAEKTQPSCMCHRHVAEWVATGETGGEFSLCLEELERETGSLREDVDNVKTDIEGLNISLSGLKDLFHGIGNSTEFFDKLNKIQDDIDNINEAISGSGNGAIRDHGKFKLSLGYTGAAPEGFDKVVEDHLAGHPYRFKIFVDNSLKEETGNGEIAGGGELVEAMSVDVAASGSAEDVSRPDVPLVPVGPEDSEIAEQYIGRDYFVVSSADIAGTREGESGISYELLSIERRQQKMSLYFCCLKAYHDADLTYVSMSLSGVTSVTFPETAGYTLSPEGGVSGEQASDEEIDNIANGIFS